MSGSGGGSTGGQWGDGGSADDCDFTVTTTLRSPDPAGLAGIHVGQILVVVVDEAKPAVEVMAGDQRVGSIVERVPKFVACTRAGNKYRAEVRTVEGDVVSVATRRA